MTNAPVVSPMTKIPVLPFRQVLSSKAAGQSVAEIGKYNRCFDWH